MERPETVEEPRQGIATEVTADELRQCAGLLNQLSRHIRDGHFYTEWDSGKGWYFDESDIDKNLGLVFQTMKILLTDNLIRMNENDKEGKTIVSELFDYIKNKN